MFSRPRDSATTTPIHAPAVGAQRQASFHGLPLDSRGYPSASRPDHSTAATPAPLSINPTLLHGTGVNAISFPGSAGDDSSSMFRASDSELAELETLLRPQTQPQTQTQQHQQPQHHAHQQPLQQQRPQQQQHPFDGSDAHQRLGSDSSLGGFSQPIRAVPRHLDQMAFSPLSPNEMYSPDSGSASAGLSGTDFFPSDDFGSFTDSMTSPSMAHDFSGGQDRIGGRNGSIGAIGGGATTPGSSGKVLSSRSRSGRRVSGSYGRPEASTAQHAIVIPHAGSPGFSAGGSTASGHPLSSVAWPSGSVPSRPQAMSVPTYLPHRPLDLAGWGDATTGVSIGVSPSTHSPFAQAGFYPSTSMSQPNRLAEIVMGVGKLGGEPAVASAPVGNEMSQAVAELNTDTKQIGRSAALLEKRKKRRESHNLVERKRRDNVGLFPERVQIDNTDRLATLLPEFMLETPARGAGNGVGEEGDGSEGEGSGQPMSPQAAAAQASRPNKGVVLSKSVEYIRLLMQRNEELEHLLRHTRPGADLSTSAATITHYDASMERAPPQQTNNMHMMLGGGGDGGSGTGSPLVQAKMEEADAMEV